jgi:hypothetical protein
MNFFRWIYVETYYLVYDLMIYIFPLAFAFFLVAAIGLKEFDKKINLRQIVKSIFARII